MNFDPKKKLYRACSVRSFAVFLVSNLKILTILPCAIHTVYENIIIHRAQCESYRDHVCEFYYGSSPRAVSSPSDLRTAAPLWRTHT